MPDKKRVRRSSHQIVEKQQEANRLLGAGQSLGHVLQALGIAQVTYPPLGRLDWDEMTPSV